jgi:hypothetical protein
VDEVWTGASNRAPELRNSWITGLRSGGSARIVLFAQRGSDQLAGLARCLHRAPHQVLASGVVGTRIETEVPLGVLLSPAESAGCDPASLPACGDHPHTRPPVAGPTRPDGPVCPRRVAGGARRERPAAPLRRARPSVTRGRRVSENRRRAAWRGWLTHPGRDLLVGSPIRRGQPVDVATPIDRRSRNLVDKALPRPMAAPVSFSLPGGALSNQGGPVDARIDSRSGACTGQVGHPGAQRFLRAFCCARRSAGGQAG